LVARQLQTYVQWLELPGRAEQVIKAFQNAGAVLCELAAIFGKDPKHRAVEAWGKLAQQEPCLVRQPGIIIGSYTPHLAANVKDVNAHKATSFGPHRDRLLVRGITVLELAAPDAKNAVLPSLSAGAAV
jgi:hypothetical protein